MTSAETAVADSLKRGEELITATDETGREFVQRPINLNVSKRTRAPRKKKGERVKVYNKVAGWMFASDCRIPPNGECTVLRADIEKYPLLKQNLVIME